MKHFLATLSTFAMLLPLGAGAHTRLKSSAGVSPRSTNAGIKVGPCGGLPRGATPPSLEVGSTLTVTWEETIQHPGRFEIYFSKAGDTGFTLLKTIPDNQDGSSDLPHQFSTTITLPSETCTGCTLQMIQVMTENPTSPTNYYSCADLKLVPSGMAPEPTPTPTPDPNSTPEPNPTHSCEESK